MSAVGAPPRVDEVRRYTRRLTQPLARRGDPPLRIEVQVGKGYHLLLNGPTARLLHVIIAPVGSGPGGPVTTRTATLRFRAPGALLPEERRWVGALRQGLLLAEKEPGWEGFLLWASQQPAAMLPDATFDPDRDPPSGNIQIIRLETRCNGRCAFCSARGILPDLVLDADQIRRRLRGMRRAGRREVALTGGEPTLREDLVAHVAAAREEGFTSISLLTNAMRLDSGPLVDRLVEAGLTSVFVPILSPDAATHDRLIGVRGAFGRSTAGIDRCLALGLEVGFNTVITTVNLAHLAPLVSWLPERFRAPRIVLNLSFVALQGWALDHLYLIPRLTALRPHLQAALDIAERLGMDVSVPGLCGVPMCVLPGYERHFEEFSRGVQGMPENRRHVAVCAACSLRGRCSGFWSAYFDHFGEDELGYPDGVVPL